MTAEQIKQAIGDEKLKAEMHRIMKTLAWVTMNAWQELYNIAKQAEMGLIQRIPYSEEEMDIITGMNLQSQQYYDHFDEIFEEMLKSPESLAAIAPQIENLTKHFGD